MRRSIVLGVLLLVAAACASAGGEPVGGTIAVTGVDYSFQGVPELVAPGAEFTFTNGSDSEVHEMVIVQVVEGETRTLQEILELPEEESDALIAEFMGVLIDTPSGETFNPEGDATSITVTEPGRYAVVCFFPQGLDEETFNEAMATADPNAEGPPPLPEGTPHAFLGMATEFTVEG